MRRVRLHKSASFKTIFEQILKKHKNDAKQYPKITEITILKPPKKGCGNTSKTISNKYAKLSDAGSHFGPSYLIDCRCGTFSLQPVFRNLWGVRPWTNVGIPWDTLGPMFYTCLQEFTRKFAPMSKIPEQHVDTSQTNGTNCSFKKASKDLKHYNHNQSKQILFYFCCLTRPRKSEAPGLSKIGSAELLKG